MFPIVLRSVMLNFMFNSTVPWGAQIFGQILLWVFSERMFWMKLTFKTTDWEQQIVFLNVSELYPINWREWKAAYLTGSHHCLMTSYHGFPCFLKKKDNKKLTWGMRKFSCLVTFAPAWWPLHLPDDLWSGTRTLPGSTIASWLTLELGP